MRPITIAELAILSGRDVRTVGRALADAGIVELGRKGRAVLYDSGLALKAIYRSGESSRERLEVARAELAELELALKRGEQLPTGETVNGWRKRVTAARARLLAIPSKIAPQIAPPGKIVQVRDTLTREIHQALDELAGDGSDARAAA